MKGGRRNGAGRPMGAKDRKPRVGSKWHDWAETISQRYEAHEYFGEDVANSRDLLQKIYRSKNVPLKYRMYAATKAIDFEPPPAVEAVSEDVEKWRDELAAEIMKHREIILAKREELLRCRVTAGELNDHQIELVRTLWGDMVEHCAYHIDNQACPDGAPTAEVLTGEIIPPARSVPRGCDMPENMQPASQLRSERVQNGAGQPQNEPAASWNSSKAPAGLVVLFTQPYRNFYTGSAHRYEASAGGECLSMRPRLTTSPI